MDGGTIPVIGVNAHSLSARERTTVSAACNPLSLAISRRQLAFGACIGRFHSQQIAAHFRPTPSDWSPGPVAVLTIGAAIVEALYAG